VAVRFCSVALCCIVCARHRRALAREFQTDTVLIIGSQAILMPWPDAPEIMRGTPEVDAYPENAVGEKLININLAPDQEE
jgi:hypothetical protein